MELTMETVVNTGKYVVLNDGRCLFVNGYMLEDLKSGKHYPLAFCLSKITYLLRREEL